MTVATKKLSNGITLYGKDWNERLYPYAEYLPEGYETRNDWPVIILTPGIGEGVPLGADVTETQLLTAMTGIAGKNGLLKKVLAGKKYQAIILQPMCGSPAGWFMSSQLCGYASKTLAKVPDADFRRSFFEFFKRKYAGKYNVRKVSLTGFSGGGAAVMWVAEARKDEIAAIMPICPAGGGSNENLLTNMPAKFFNNSGDTKVSPASTTALFNAVKAVSKLTPESLTLTIYNASGHGGWEETYANDANIEWLISQELGGVLAPVEVDITADVNEKLNQLTALSNEFKLTAQSLADTYGINAAKLTGELLTLLHDSKITKQQQP